VVGVIIVVVVVVCVVRAKGSSNRRQPNQGRHAATLNAPPAFVNPAFYEQPVTLDSNYTAVDNTYSTVDDEESYNTVEFMSNTARQNQTIPKDDGSYNTVQFMSSVAKQDKQSNDSAVYELADSTNPDIDAMYETLPDDTGNIDVMYDNIESEPPTQQHQEKVVFDFYIESEPPTQQHQEEVLYDFAAADDDLDI